MKAVLQYRASPGFRERLAELACEWLEIVVVDERDRERFAREMVDASVLLHVLEPVTAAVLAAAPQLRLVQKLGVGVNTIDLDAARERGIAVANMPGTNSQAVAEHTLALMLATLRLVPFFDGETRAGRGWQAEGERFDRAGEIGGRTVGLVGYGAVVARLAPVLLALGATVLYSSRSEPPGAVGRRVALETLLAESDLVSLHIPLTPETHHTIDAAALERMHPGAVLVNTARGALVDEEALCHALRSRRLRAAGLDVFEREPVDPQSPLLTLDNVVLSPHIAWLTPETLDRSMSVALENCRRVRDGEPLLHRVV
ncbi:MAG: 2-hydroxyacid dehydrogenase [Myxococcota bacterium]